MHITLEVQKDGSRAVLCYERESKRCEIIRYDGDFESIPALITIARSLGADRILIDVNVINEELMTGLKGLGFSPSLLLTMEKKL